MKILIIGGNGTIGKHVSAVLKKKHDLIIAGKTSGDIQVELADSASIKKMFEEIGNLDAIISIAGEAKWDKFEKLSEEDFYIGIRSKIMGQVNLVRIGKNFLNQNGSITLTTGILADEPEYMTTSAAMVNGAIHSFVKAVAIELERGIRINAVSSDLVEEAAEKYEDFFPGHNPVPMHKIANAYVRCVEGRINGEIVRLKE